MLRILLYPFRWLFFGVGAGLRALRRRKLKGWIELELAGAVHRHPSGRPNAQALLRRLQGRPEPSSIELPALRRLVEGLEGSRVRGVLVKLRDAQLDWASAQEIRRLLKEVRDGGRPVVVHAPRPLDELDALAASGGTRILTGPAGGFEALGTKSRGVFLRGLLDRVGVVFEAISAGAFKSAPDALTRHERSDADRTQVRTLLRGRDQALIAALAESRSQSEEEIRQHLEEGPFDPEAAQARGLLDGECRDEDLPQALEEESMIPASAVLAVLPRRRPRLARGDRIAVVRVNGAIVDRAPRVGRGAAAEEDIVQALRAAHQDRRIRGVILAIDSGGGSVTASDTIYGAVLRLNQDKPTVALMETAAASGGYYVACGASAIVAEPHTLTGSIGVFGVVPRWPELLARLGVGTDAIHELARANLMDPNQALLADDRERVQRQVDGLYHRFVTLVAERRGRSLEEIHEVAQGRVWSGKDAHAVGLVDGLGGWDEAWSRVEKASGRSIRGDAVYFGGKSGPRPEPYTPTAAALASVPTELAELVAMVETGVRWAAWAPRS
ncbi:MAG: signal peptide peptidase SppA [Myxococcota bacterium]